MNAKHISSTSVIALGRFFASKASKDDEPEQEPTKVDDVYDTPVRDKRIKNLCLEGSAVSSTKSVLALAHRL